MKKAIRKIFLSLFVVFGFILCSCEPHKSKNISDYPNSMWESNTDSILNIEVYVDSSSDITSKIMYDNETILFTNYIVSEVIYFSTIDKSKSFTVSHNYVKDGSYIECSVKKEDISSIFKIEERIDIISFKLTKKSQ